jgi:hypothetical protein
MRCTYAVGLSSVGEFYRDRHANGFESGAAVPGDYPGRLPGKETLHLAHVLFTPEPVSKYKLVEGLVVYFLYFEFIALIVKYFESGFHFPLRYLSISASPRLCA